MNAAIEVKNDECESKVKIQILNKLKEEINIFII